jgi:nucleotide-binding universal stress UspA family protein
MKPQILVPFDFSETAERALAWAADFQKMSGAPPVRLVHALSSRPSGTADVALETLLPSPQETKALEARMLEQARRHELTATAAVVIRASNIGDILVDAAKEAGAELIVMGSHGRTGVKRLLLGSVAEHVVRHAKCPVVTVRGGAEGA